MSLIRVIYICHPVQIKEIGADGVVLVTFSALLCLYTIPLFNPLL